MYPLGFEEWQSAKASFLMISTESGIVKVCRWVQQQKAHLPISVQVFEIVTFVKDAFCINLCCGITPFPSVTCSRNGPRNSFRTHWTLPSTHWTLRQKYSRRARRAKSMLKSFWNPAVKKAFQLTSATQAPSQRSCCRLETFDCMLCLAATGGRWTKKQLHSSLFWRIYITNSKSDSSLLVFANTNNQWYF